MRYFYLIILIPTLLFAQDFPFEQEFDLIPVEIDGYQTFQPWSIGIAESTPEFCDIDADGDFDLFFGVFIGYISYFENCGAPNLADFSFITSALDSIQTLPDGGSGSNPEFCDIDDDGDLDLFNGGGYVGLYENEGTPGSFSFGDVDTLKDVDLNNIVAWHVTIADIDADGDYDLFNGHYQGHMYFYRNIGTPDRHVFYFEDDNWEGINAGDHADPTFCDLDADNDYDLFIGNENGKIWFYENIGDSASYNFATPVMNWLGIDVGEHASPEFCDIDGDGDFDLFVGREIDSSNNQGDVYFYENTGTTTNPVFEYLTSNYLTIDVGYVPMEQFVDIDGDDDLDLMVGVGSAIRYFKNTGDLENPYFVLENTSYENIALVGIQPYFCDIDADGDYDLFAGTGSIPTPPGLHLYLNRGTPQNPDYVLFSDDLVPGVFFVIITPSLADIDSDGDFDLFVFDDWGDLYYYENSGDSLNFDFDYPEINWQGINVADHRYARFHDIDGDEDLDLFFDSYPQGNQGPGNICLYRNEGNPQNPSMVLETEEYLPIGASYACSWFCDIDADGYTDLFVGELWGGILFFHGINDSSGFIPPPYQKFPRPCIHIGPNPANPITWVTFNLPYPQKATLAVYNLLGQKVATLAQGLQPPGSQIYFWNASNFSSGTYLIRLETDVTEAVQPIIVVK